MLAPGAPSPYLLLVTHSVSPRFYMTFPTDMINYTTNACNVTYANEGAAEWGHETGVDTLGQLTGPGHVTDVACPDPRRWVCMAAVLGYCGWLRCCARLLCLGTVAGACMRRSTFAAALCALLQHFWVCTCAGCASPTAVKIPVSVTDTLPCSVF